MTLGRLPSSQTYNIGAVVILLTFVRKSKNILLFFY